MKKITKYDVHNDDMLYIGTVNNEEYYQKTDEKEGWSFMGLRPETEEKLRENARDSDPCDYLGMSRADFSMIARYFDFDRFADDMEDDWYDRHDVQVERTGDDGDVLYLGFGSGTDAKRYFKEHNITDYNSYVEHFEEIGLNEKEFTDYINKYVNI